MKITQLNIIDQILLNLKTTWGIETADPIEKLRKEKFSYCSKEDFDELVDYMQYQNLIKKVKSTTGDHRAYSITLKAKSILMTYGLYKKYFSVERQKEDWNSAKEFILIIGSALAGGIFFIEIYKIIVPSCF